MSDPRLIPVSTAAAPAAIGPYSQAVRFGDTVWTSGQIALCPETGVMLGDDVAAEARQVLRNLQAVLEAAGTGLDRALRCTVYLVSMADFAAVNEVYAEWFAGARPARACVEVAALPKGARVEIDCVAALPAAD